MEIREGTYYTRSGCKAIVVLNQSGIWWGVIINEHGHVFRRSWGQDGSYSCTASANDLVQRVCDSCHTNFIWPAFGVDSWVPYDSDQLASAARAKGNMLQRTDKPGEYFFLDSIGTRHCKIDGTWFNFDRLMELFVWAHDGSRCGTLQERKT